MKFNSLGKFRTKRWSQLGLVVLLLAVFALGDLVGSGRLYFGTHGRYAAVATGLPEHLDYSSVNEVYDTLRQNYNGQLTSSQVLDGLKQGLAESTHDPYTEYFTASQAKDFQNQLNNSFSGIGAELGKDSDNNLIVVAPIAGMPADKAGLKGQDIITTINGESTTGMSIDQAVTKIRGKQGTKVTLQIVRGHAQALSFTITRDNIQVPSVDTKMLDNNIGYISISTFGDDTTNGIQQAAAKMKQNGAKGIILDLRSNPGGLVDAAVNVASEWLPKDKVIMQEKRGSTVVGTKYALGDNQLTGIPTVVLVDGNSASASEITASALHDNGQAYIIGEKSYGKGVEQQILPFTDGSQLKVTVASWYRPNGQNINKKGITPDKTVKISDEDAKAGTDTQKNAAIDYLMSKQ